MQGIDLVGGIAAVLVAHLPGISSAQLAAIEADLRARLGGQRHYVKATPSRSKAARYREARARGATAAEAAQLAGCTARHARRLERERTFLA